MSSLRELFRRRDLLLILAWREVKIRYKQTVMGVLWAVLMPAVIVAAGIVVRMAVSFVAQKPLRLDELALVSVKAVPWAFFVGSLRFATVSLIGNSNLVTKIYMRREIFPLACTLSQAIDMAAAASVLAVALTIARIGASLHLLWVPVLLSILVLLTSAIGVIMAAGSLFFRDVKYLVEVFVTFAIFFTPVFYDTRIFGPWQQYFLLNPVAPILEGLAATVVLHEAPHLGWVLYSAVFALSTAGLALLLFNWLDPYFAEWI